MASVYVSMPNSYIYLSTHGQCWVDLMNLIKFGDNLYPVLFLRHVLGKVHWLIITKPFGQSIICFHLFVQEGPKTLHTEFHVNQITTEKLLWMNVKMVGNVLRCKWMKNQPPS